MEKPNKKGFTLIELLVVIAIIGLLASIVLVSLNTARQKARDTKRLGDLRQVMTALELYYDSQATPAYPSVVGCTVANWSGTMSTALQGGTGFMTKVPVDPTNNATYYYAYASDGTDYVLWSKLEISSNPALLNSVHTNPLMGCNCTTPAYCIQP
jgi:type II secretion system protein G